MKQVVLSPRTGALDVAEVPVPQVRRGTVLVRTVASVVSAGTERLVIELAGKSLLGKARARPDLVREAINKVSGKGCGRRYGRLSCVSIDHSRWDTVVRAWWWTWAPA